MRQRGQKRCRVAPVPASPQPSTAGLSPRTRRPVPPPHATASTQETEHSIAPQSTSTPASSSRCRHVSADNRAYGATCWRRYSVSMTIQRLPHAQPDASQNTPKGAVLRFNTAPFALKVYDDSRAVLEAETGRTGVEQIRWSTP